MTTTKLLALSLLAACATEADVTTAEQHVAGRFYLLPEAGTGQSRVVMNSFGRLSVVLTDWDNAPLDGQEITFTVPAMGASALFVGGNRATTDEFGRATITPWAGSIKGTYTVWASADNADPMPFTLTNNPDAPELMTVVLGSDQTRPMGMAFEQPLTVEVSDRFGNTLEGIAVEFVAPANGPTTILPADVTLTDDEGRAAMAAMAGNQPGSYTVEAKTVGAPNVSFTLTNVEPADHGTLTNGTVKTNVSFEPMP